MIYSMAPLEGITTPVYRQAHRDCFPPLDAYYAPFLSPSPERGLTPKDCRELSDFPATNLIPQLLTNSPAAFCQAARQLTDLGFPELNLNLGCPSGTVTAKGKGAGFLADPEKLDRFFAEIYQTLPDLRLSVKTRLGVRDPAEFPAILAVYHRYPLTQLILHPRVRQDFYRHPARQDAFAQYLPLCRAPLVYNGDLFTPQQCHGFAERFPTVTQLMLGRGLITNPGLHQEATGGPPLDKPQLLAFHDRLLADYTALYSGDRPVLAKMKELWSYQINLFADAAKEAKAIRKAQTLADYRRAVAALFRERDFIPAS